MPAEFPAWLDKYASLDDDALAALGNRGLVRRGHKQAVELISAADDEVVLGCPAPAGASPMTITLTAAGPTAARCGCPVGGVCVHLIAASIWARGQLDNGGAAAPGVGGVDVIAEVLGWDPDAVNRSVGIAAVRALAATAATGDFDQSADSAASLLTDRTSAGTVTIGWPGSPRVVFTAGAGVAGMIISGQHSDAARKRWQLEAVIRLWRSHGQTWKWPDGLIDDGRLQSGEREAAEFVAASIEALVGQGLAHLGDDAADRLRGAGQRAALEDLGLLARLAGIAAPLVGAVADHNDDGDESATLAALADAWGLATALILSAEVGVPDGLRGTRSGSPAVLGRLVPLGVRWWTAPNGSRGLTAHWWDVDHRRIETMTTGRALGADPAFNQSWELPLVWGASAQQLTAGPLILAAAERRDDGQLSPTTRTRVERTDDWSGIDLDQIIDQVNAAGADPALVGFAGPPPRIRIVRPRRGSDLSLDEVTQQVVWQLTDSDGIDVELRLDAGSMAERRLTWLLARKDPIRGVVVADGDRPDALLVGKAPEVISLTLTPITELRGSKRVRRRADRLRDQRRAGSTGPTESVDPIVRLVRAIEDVVVSLAVTGRTRPSQRQRETLRRRIDQADNLGLSSLVAAARPLMEAPTPATLLRAAFVVNRLLAISAVEERT